MTVFVVLIHHPESDSHYVEGVFAKRDEAELAAMRVLESEGNADAEILERQVQ